MEESNIKKSFFDFASEIIKAKSIESRKLPTELKLPVDSKASGKKLIE
jgi:hypothetical protein